MTVSSPGFHAKGRWYFRREEDGSVRILAPDSLGPGASQQVILDAGTWCSVVASVSATGETGQKFRRAEAFHGGMAEAMPATAGPPAGATTTFPTCPTCCSHDHHRAEIQPASQPTPKLGGA